MVPKRVCRVGSGAGGAGEQEDQDRGVLRSVEVVLAVTAGNGVRLDLDASVSAMGEVVDTPVVTFALGEDHI